ncbi:MAG: hypothetical protein ACPGTO_01790 [Polaribacter sp.]
MKTSNFNKIIVLTFCMCMIASCQSEYTKLVKNELASGIKNDTIFYNLKFGNTKKEFYEICWNLNKQGTATHGENNSYVKTILEPKDSINKTKRIVMLFYARFTPKDIITAMDIKFSYSAWAPWNTNLQSENLIPAIKDTLLKWYPGNPFMKVKNDILVKVDGNRQIQLVKESDRDVSVVIENLEYKYNRLVK